MQKHATTVGLYCKHIVVRCRLLDAMKYDVCARSLEAVNIQISQNCVTEFDD